MTADTRHNVLVLLADEHDPRVTGIAGHPMVQTPNLDALARRGTRFTNAYTPSPVCVPARASLATGRWVHDIGYWDNATGYDGRVPGWGHALQAAGVRVESIGKLHYRSADDPTGFDRQHEPMHLAEGVGQVWGSVRDPMPEVFGPSPLYKEIGAGESAYNRYDMRSAAAAVAWLEEKARERAGQRAAAAEPWVLFVGFVAPHFPLVVPEPFLDRYPPESVPWPKLQPADGYRQHPWVAAQRRHCDHDAAIGTDARRRLAIASYFGLVTFMDALVGDIVAALERTGFADTTRVIYSADHGDNLGARGMWNKSLLYRESTGIPLLLAGRGVPQAINETHVGLVDLFPTLLQALGVAPDPADAALPGRSLLDTAAAPDPARIGFAEYHAIGSPSAAFMVVRGHYKYHHYVGYEPELFDLQDDPEETRSVHAAPRHARALADCEAALRGLLDPERVDAAAKADQRALVEACGGRDAVMAMERFGATPVPE